MKYLNGYADSCDEALEILVSKHSEIRVFEICFGSKNSDRGLQTLLTADSIAAVSLCGARLITGETLELHSNSAQHIQHLALRNCSLTDEGLLKIMEICGIKLTSLDLSGSEITGEGLHVLQDKFKNMEKLSLAWCRGLTQQGLLEILNMCGSKLQNLNISATNITGKGLEELQGKLANLKTLNLEHCYSFTDQGFSEIINISGPLLKTVQLSGANISTETKNRIKLNRPNLKFE